MFQADSVKSTASIAVSVLAQIREGLKNPQAFIPGALIGGIMPFGAYHLAHTGLDYSRELYLQPSAYMLAGVLAYSAKTVYQWGLQAFSGDKIKAFGFVAFLEGMLSFAPPQLNWFSWICLAYLIIINAVATACSFAQADKDYKPAKKVVRKTPIKTVDTAEKKGDSVPRIQRKRIAQVA